MNGYEQPTNEYRLLQRPVVKSVGPGTYTTAGYHVTLQRKWRVCGELQFTDLPMPTMCCRDEWRDCESVLGKEIEL